MELTQRSRLDVAGRANSAASVGRALEMLSDADVLRLRALARLRARANGLGADDIRRVNNLTECDYDSARRRMRRALLRTGLSWSAK